MNGFTKIPNALIANAALTLEEKMVCIYIMSKPADWEYSPVQMAKELQIYAGKMKKILRSLKQKGVLQSTQNKTDKGKFAHASMVITEVSFSDPRKTDPRKTDRRISDRRKMVPLTNTKEQKTETSKTEKNKTERERAGRSKTHSQSSLSSSSATQGDPAEMEHWFVEQTKAAAEGIGCPREVLTKFYLHWTQPTADGVPLWKTKSAFDFKARLMTWIINER